MDRDISDVGVGQGEVSEDGGATRSGMVRGRTKGRTGCGSRYGLYGKKETGGVG